MSGRARFVVPALLAVLVAAGGILLAGGLNPAGAPVAPSDAAATGTSGPAEATAAVVTPPPTPTPRPELGGTELYGYVPYWQMTDSMVTYLRDSPVSTLLLFSVAARKNGAINTAQTGYRRIAGSIGQTLISDAHARRARVELVFTSFGTDKNAQFFGRAVPTATPAPDATSPEVLPSPTVAPIVTPLGSPGATPAPAPWHRTVNELVGLAVDLGVDGINVDVELLDELDRPAYGEFLGALRAALRAAIPNARVTVATEAGPRGVGNAAAAAGAGVDRVFLMGYDYHWSGSQPGATAPLDRTDGTYSLRWSIDQYVEAGVPRDRILLGLPLYGMQWRTEGFDRSSTVIGKGVTWVFSSHADVLLAPGFVPFRDWIEHVEYVVQPEGVGYLQTFFDSPATLRVKLALARDNGLAGAGFWALGYERGLPGYLELMRAFRAGKVGREEAPPPP
jgi:hypothetical protein